MSDDACVWVAIQADPDPQQTWQAGCATGPDDRVYEFNAGGPHANGFRYCPFCGKALRERRDA